MCKGTLNGESVYLIKQSKIPSSTFDKLNGDWISANGGIPVDQCIGNEVENLITKGIITVYSCCGHGKWHSEAMALFSEKDKLETLGYETEVFENRLIQFNLKTGTQLGGQE